MRPDVHVRARWLALLVFFQMLPATLVAPAIRPLFAQHHAGREGAMHAFMAINMLGGLLVAPWLGTLADRRGRPRWLLSLLAAVDAALLLLLAAPLPTGTVLALRFAEGAAHVGAATLLLAEAAAYRRQLGDGRAMGMAGAGIMAAIASGSAVGGFAVGFDPRAPFWLAAALSSGVALTVWRSGAPGAAPAPAAGADRRRARLELVRRLGAPLAAAFVERFAVGCVIVTFALFAHTAHGLSDSAVGYHFALLTLPFALLTYPAGRLSDSVPRAAVMAVGALVYGFALMALGQAETPLLAWVMAAAGCGAACIFAPTLCYAASLAGPEQRGRAMALVNAAGCLGMLLGPAAAGITSALFRTSDDPLSGYRAVFGLAGIGVLTWLAIAGPWLVSRLREERAALAPGSSCPAAAGSPVGVRGG